MDERIGQACIGAKPLSDSIFSVFCHRSCPLCAFSLAGSEHQNCFSIRPNHFSNKLVGGLDFLIAQYTSEICFWELHIPSQLNLPKKCL
jgi:hypothetical protein